jgi:chromosomal replication initiation ATPase DnaA
MREVHKTYMAELEIEILREKNKKLKQEINQLKDLLDKHLNIKTTRMSKYRGEEVTLARQMTMYLTKEKTELNGEEIAQIFNRDRTTVLHSIQKIRGQLSNKFDDTIKKDVFNLNVLI